MAEKRESWSVPYSTAEQRIATACLDALVWLGGAALEPRGRATQLIYDAVGAMTGGPVLSTRATTPRGEEREPVGLSRFTMALQALERDGKVARDIRGRRTIGVELVGVAFDERRHRDAMVSVDAYRKRQTTAARARAERETSGPAAVIAEPVDQGELIELILIAEPSRADPPGPDSTPVTRPAVAVESGPAAPALEVELGPVPVAPIPADAEHVAAALLTQVVAILARPEQADVEHRLAEVLEHSTRRDEKLRQARAALEGVTRERDALRARARLLESNIAAVVKAPRIDDRTRLELERLMSAPGPSKG